jgi:hypothetical protein
LALGKVEPKLALPFLFGRHSHALTWIWRADILQLQSRYSPIAEPIFSDCRAGIIWL